MKNLLCFVVGLLFFVLFIWAFITGLDREARRKCIVAMDHCEKYEDAGACDPKYLKVCEGIEYDD